MTTAATVEVILGLGANLGDRLSALQQGVDIISRDPAVRAVAVASVFDTDPVGGPEQPDYLNSALRITTTLSPAEVLGLAQEAEVELARERSVRWGPRTLDVDVINYGSFVSADPDLTLPHPRARERGFVLVPAAQIAPDVVLAGTGKSVAELLAELDPIDRRGVRLRADLPLQLPSTPTL